MVRGRRVAMNRTQPLESEVGVDPSSPEFRTFDSPRKPFSATESWGLLHLLT